MYRKAVELKDDIVHSKDDFYKLNLCSMEDAESKDDIAIREDGYCAVVV